MLGLDWLESTWEGWEESDDPRSLAAAEAARAGDGESGFWAATESISSIEEGFTGMELTFIEDGSCFAVAAAGEP